MDVKDDKPIFKPMWNKYWKQFELVFLLTPWSITCYWVLCLIQPPAVSFLLGKKMWQSVSWGGGGERDKSNSAERRSLDHHAEREIILFSKEKKDKRERRNRTRLSTQMGSKRGLKLSPRWIEEEFALAEVATSWKINQTEYESKKEEISFSPTYCCSLEDLLLLLFRKFSISCWGAAARTVRRFLPSLRSYF